MSRLLTSSEQTALARALAQRTHARVRVGREALTRDEGIALWNASAPLTQGSAAVATRHRSDMSTCRRALGAGTMLAATASLSACATLGGNVKGDFACRAPDGICAPTSTIDDAALALIGGDTGSLAPAGPYAPSIDTSPRMTLASAKPARSGEKVLRIVFPAHIDGAGRFRETTAVHAVVERGAWMAAGAMPVARPRASTLDDSTARPVEVSTGLSRSLGELAASAPEVAFPDRIAEADVRLSSVEAASSTPVSAASSPERVAAEGQLGRVPQSLSVPSGAAPATASSPRTASLVASPGAAISYTLPPKGQPVAANPLDAIRAQVAEQLKSARSAGTGPAIAPIKPQAGDAAAVGKAPSKPANAPSLFPVSGVNP